MNAEEILDAAIEKKTPAERAAYLDGACGEDAELRNLVTGLLKSHEEAGSFLERPLFEAPPPDATSDHPLRECPGTVIGPYKLLEQIGEGGMGVVFMAEQTKPVQRRVALKIIKAGMDTRQVVARFEAERQALAMMDHPNIARVLDAGATETGRPYFVMELVRGVPMTEFCNQKSLSIRERLELFVTVCQAVQHAHQKGIIHRDIKPTNVLVTLHDGRPMIKVIDFGVAKATGQKLTDKTLFTGFAQMIGTPLYMSPEQAEMTSQDIDTRSDIFSAGVLLYELLTGSTPFDSQRLKSASFDELRRIIREEEPPRPSMRLTTIAAEAASTVSKERKSDPRQLSRLFRGELDWIVMKCLEKDRTRRYETASALASDVERYLRDEPVQACPPSVRYRFGKFARRNKAVLLTAAAVIVALVVGTGVSTWQAIRAFDAEAKSNTSEQQALKSAQQAHDAADSERKAKEDEKVQLKKAEEVLKLLGRAFSSPDPARDGHTITVAEVLDRSVRDLKDRFADDPETKRYLLVNIVNSYQRLGLSNEAIPLLEQAIRIDVAAGRQEKSDTLVAMCELANAYRNAGRVGDAIKLHEEVVNRRKTKLGPEHAATLVAMGELETDYGAAGRIYEALKLHEELYELMKVKLGPNHSQTLKTMSQLADDYRTTNRIGDAIRLREELLKLVKVKLGPEDLGTLATIGNLAGDYIRAGRIDEAVPMLEESSKLITAKMGPDHPATLNSLNNLGFAYHVAGRTGDAIRVYEETVKLTKAKLGLNHPDTLDAMRNLADAYVDAGRTKEAIELHEETLRLMKAILGPESPGTLEEMYELSFAYRAAGRIDDGLRLHEEELKLVKTKWGPADPRTIYCMSNLADAYQEAGRVDESIRMFEETVKVAKATLGPKDYNTIALIGNLGYVYRIAGRGDEATRMHEESLKLMKALKGPEHPETFEARQNLVNDYLLAGRAGDAIQMGEELLKIAKVKLGPEHVDTLKAMDCLVIAYVRANRPAEAEQLAQECLKIRERKSSDDWQTFLSRSLLGVVFIGQKKYVEAEPLLISGYEGMQERVAKMPTNERHCLKDAVERLVQLYSVKNEPEKAATWKAKLTEFDKAAIKGNIAVSKKDTPSTKKAGTATEPNPPSPVANKSGN